MSNTVCIVGGGPAGMILALLLARQGIQVTVLEAAKDFDREFRGDTLHPAILELLDGLGLADRLLALPHTKAKTVRFITARGTTTIADFRRLRTKFPYLAIMPQVRFLGFLAKELEHLPNFRLIMGARVEGLLEQSGRVSGVRYQDSGGSHELRVDLTVGSDGRFSKVRQLGGFELTKLSPGQDVLWFSLPRQANDPKDNVDQYIGKGHLLVTIDRDSWWQVGYSIPKGKYQEAKAAGVAPIQAFVTKMLPWLGDRALAFNDWNDSTLLSVEVARVKRWYKDGLLLIGDAAHVISPIGGVGINLAVQDAIAAANILTAPLKAGTVQTSDLAKVQKKREWLISLVQSQQVSEERAVTKVLDADESFEPPLPLVIISHIPFLRDLPGLFTAYGLIPVRLNRALHASDPITDSAISISSIGA
jgi:2-polyprenyl-6-methoxyphenol hydroxylase-like FAD-dependent oxidoreductase